MDFSDPQGYAHPLYTSSLAEYGRPYLLPGCGGWILIRQVPGSSYQDAMGPYPLFFCKDWHNLTTDLDSLRNQIISMSLVIGPFSKFPLQEYRQYFDICRPYREHYILDLSLPLEKTIAKGHRRSARRALRNLEVEMIKSPNIDLDEWTALYGDLIKRHNIKGIRAFSREGFEKQIAVPNVLYFRVTNHGNIVGGNLFILQENVAYAHLSAFNDAGYELGAPYAVKWCALEHLSKLVRWVNFGGHTSSDPGSLTGLDYFKKGWSSTTEQSYFCGKILDLQKYEELLQQTNTTGTTWFPAYRQGEF